MIKLFFLILFLVMGSYSLRADESQGDDQDFVNQLSNIKSPFDDGLPKPPPPVVVVPPPVLNQNPPSQPKKHKHKRRAPVPVVEPLITPPALNLQGVIVGEEMHQAIINGQVVPLNGTIEGAEVNSVTKEGVEILFKGKKFFLKVD